MQSYPNRLIGSNAAQLVSSPIQLHAIIEVKMTSLEDLDGEWDREELSGGEYLLIRSCRDG
jgi:hypothetical protein